MRTLVADDDLIITTILSNALTRSGMQVTVAHDGDVAWQALNSLQPPSLAILDWMMPNLDGLELCRRIRSTPRLAGMYVILVTARDSREDLVAGLEAGADDYMAKPINLAELQARIGVGLRVAKLQQNLAQSVKELRSTRDHLAKMASTDVLTGVYSRRWWFDAAEKEFARARRYGRTFSLLMADLDWFKQINDSYGHEAGDRVLNQFGDMLRKTCRKSDVIGRLGGEEFAIVLYDAGRDKGLAIAERIRLSFVEAAAMIDGRPVGGTVSMGMVVSEQGMLEIATLLAQADGALYCAKERGRNRIEVASLDLVMPRAQPAAEPSLAPATQTAA